MSQQILIGEVMTPVPHLIEAGACILTAQQLMKRHGFHHLPVTDHGKPYGIISDREIALAQSMAVHVIDDRGITVQEVCTHPAYWIPPEEPLDVVALHMWDERIDSALIIDREKIIGIFTSSDACRVLGQSLRGQVTRRVNE